MATITPFPRAQLHEHTIADELQAFLAYCRNRRGLSANTVTAYRKDLIAAGAALCAPLDKISIADIEANLVSRNEKPGTTNRRIVSLRRFFRWCIRQGYCDRNPLEVIEAKQDDEHLPRSIQTDSDLWALDGAIARSPQPYRLIFTLLRETGMRADEVLSLNVGDVVLDAGREGLRVCEAKNNRDRMVVLDSDRMRRSLRLLRSWVRDLVPHAAPTTPMFRSNRGTRVSYDALHYQWVKVCQAANLIDAVDGQEQPRYTIHQLQHTVGSTLIRELPEQIASRILGHRDPRSTRRYAEVTEEQVWMALAQKRSCVGM
jgi:integrase/recombinase XerD